MTDYEARVRSIEKIVRNGYIRHDEIEPALEKAGLSQIQPDDISELVKSYKYRGSENAVTAGAKRIVEKICSYLSAILIAGIMAEIAAAREFAGSLIAGKLEGFGDSFLFWLGLKKIEISGPEMVRAMAAVGAATPEIVKGMLIGAVIGYMGWKIISRLTIYLWRRQRRRKAIRRLLERYDLN